MDNNMKKMRTERNYHRIDFEKSIDSVISMLQKYKEEGWTDITCDYYGPDDREFHVSKERLETDEEQNKTYRRKCYEDLKKEFGDE
jgi:hypothetical protein